MAGRTIDASGNDTVPSQQLCPPAAGGSLTKTAPPPRDVRLAIPSGVELFLDIAGVPHIRIPEAKGRKALPIRAPLVRSFVILHLHSIQGGILPRKSDIEGMLALLEAQAFLNGTMDHEADWKEIALAEDPLLDCICQLVGRKAPHPWEATAGQLLDALNVFAAKEQVEKGPNWPRAPHTMSTALAQRQLILGELGIVVQRLARRGTARNWLLQIRPNDTGDTGAKLPSSDASPQVSLPNSQSQGGLAALPADNDALVSALENTLAAGAPGNLLAEAQILEWNPFACERIVANKPALGAIQLAIKELLAGRKTANTLLVGPAGTGKEALVVHAVRTLLCDAPDPTKYAPCGQCKYCTWQLERETTFGNARKDNDYQFMRIDCARLSPDALQFEASKVAAFPGKLLVYLHELDQLNCGRVPELLKTMEDSRFIWFATAAGTGDIRSEVLKHFETQSTTNPTEEELAIFLAERCRAWGIKPDSASTLIRLAHICGQVTGDAIKVVGKAASNTERALTLAMVEASFAAP